MKFKALHLGVAALGITLVASLAGPRAGAQEKGPVIKDEAVRVLEAYAWQTLPAKFTTPMGNTIQVDKTKREANTVPFEVAREVVIVGYRSGHAQICDMREELFANFNTMMRREASKKKWTEQQMLYIQQLHRITIHFVMGKVRVEETETERKIFLEPLEAGKDKAAECNVERKKRITENIASYLKVDGSTFATAIAPPPGSAAPATTGSTPSAAQPTPTSAPAPKK